MSYPPKKYLYTISCHVTKTSMCGGYEVRFRKIFERQKSEILQRVFKTRGFRLIITNLDFQIIGTIVELTENTKLFYEKIKHHFPQEYHSEIMDSPNEFYINPDYSEEIALDEVDETVIRKKLKIT